MHLILSRRMTCYCVVEYVKHIKILFGSECLRMTRKSWMEVTDSLSQLNAPPWCLLFHKSHTITKTCCCYYMTQNYTLLKRFSHNSDLKRQINYARLSNNYGRPVLWEHATNIINMCENDHTFAWMYHHRETETIYVIQYVYLLEIVLVVPCKGFFKTQSNVSKGKTHLIWVKRSQFEHLIRC